MKKGINRRLTSCLLAIVMIITLLPVTAIPVYAEPSGSCGKQCQWTLNGTILTFSFHNYDGHSVFSAAGPISKTDLPDAQRKYITTVVIDEGIHAIRDETLSQFPALKSVKIGSDVSQIGDKAFYSCSSLESITIPDRVFSIGKEAFFLSGLKEVKLSAGLTTLGEMAFRATKLESVSIPGKLKVIPKTCFYGCHMLKNVSLSSGVEEISTSAFQGCDSLTKISIPSSVKTIGGAAFESCKKLEKADLSHVTTIGKLAFNGCSRLLEIRLSNELKTVDDLSFNNNYVHKRVIFSGTKAEFEKIASKSAGRNTDLLTGTVHLMHESDPVYSMPWVQDTEKKIMSLPGTQEVPGAVFHELKACADKAKKKRIHLKWKAVSGASGYLIYGGLRKGAYQKLDDLKGSANSSYWHSNLAPNRYYKYIVIAYKDIGPGMGDLKVLTCSPVILAATLGGKYRNTSSVSANAKKITLKAGKKQKLKVSANSKASAGKKYRNFLKIRYESTKPAIATVSRTGRIKAVSKGKCYIYAYSQDGRYKRIRVVVK